MHFLSNNLSANVALFLSLPIIPIVRLQLPGVVSFTPVSSSSFFVCRCGGGFATLEAATQTEVLVLDEEEQQQQQQENFSVEKALEEKEEEKIENEEELNDVVTAELINSRLEKQLGKMRLKDQTSKQLFKEDLVIVHEDENMLVIDKPSGVLSVSGKDKEIPSLAGAVHKFLPNNIKLSSGDHMIVHRLGMDTSGLIVMAKNKRTVQILNGVFRERKVERRYEALVAGHLEKDEGLINLPIMRDYVRPPFVRISTDHQQWKLVDLTSEQVGKTILERPKESVTKYKGVKREFVDGQPATRVILSSMTGRYHQLNVHMAAFGHPIVGDTVYGGGIRNGDENDDDGYGYAALPNGGLTPDELNELIPNPNRVDDETQYLLNESIRARKREGGSSSSPLSSKLQQEQQQRPCVHASYIKFKHPITKKIYEFTSKAPF